MHLPSLRRLVSGVAIIATASVVLVAPPVQAQAAEKSAATSLSIRLVKARIEPGQQTRITGHLAVAGDGGAKAAGRPVVLEAKPLGSTSFVPIAEVASGPRGGVSAVIEPQVTTRYRWHYLGDSETRSSRSGVAALRVGDRRHTSQRLGTSLSIRKVFRVGPLGGKDVVRGRLRVGRLSLPHRPVILLARVAGSADWTYEGIRKTRRHGVVKFVVDPSAKTAYRTVFLGSKRLRPARSGVVRVPHRPDVTIAADPESIVRGEAVTITGVVTDAGLPIVGAKVVLRSSKFGHPATARRVLATGITAADGSVVFSHTPRRSTKYRLRVAPAEGQALSFSAIAKVVVSPTSE